MISNDSAQEVRLNVRLPASMADFVLRQMETEHYTSLSEYIRALLRREMMVASAEENNETELSASIQRGLDDLEHGRTKKWDRQKFHADILAAAASDPRLKK